ncbi:MAG: DUF2130 domain-containing protein [Nitrospinota bacterium]
MPEQVITCPYCNKEIPLTEAISHQIREKLQKEFEGQAKKIEKDAKQKAKEAVNLELKDLREEIQEKEKKLHESQKAELELRKERRELEESKKAFELEMTRKLDEGRKKIQDEVLKKASENHRLKDMEKEKQINDMRTQIEELKRKAEQGSQQTQGEVLELELENILKSNFPLDRVEPVPKGIRGADILQKVHSQSGHYSGTIIWELKRTKAWNNGWIEKLKDDQREVKAEIAVLMTTTLPKEIKNFARLKGVWITDHASMIGLATALRLSLIQVASAKIAAVGKNEKMEVLYNYLSGTEFKQKIEAIVGTFSSMKQDLDQEKRAMTRIWSKREKQIERVVHNISGMYGDMQGIIGASLPQIKSLELKKLSEGDNLEQTGDDDKMEGEH